MINWKVRYAALLERYPELFDPDRRVLEVGSGTEGIARYLKRNVVGVDRSFDGTVGRRLEAVCASVLTLPFRDRAFDDVVCVDTLEHLRRGDRPRAVEELIRVAGKRVIISGPAGAFAAWGDAAYAEHIRRTGGTVPPWLEEHLEHGIPSLADLLADLLNAGFAFTVSVNEGALQHYCGLLADNYPFTSRFLRYHDDKFASAAPLCAATGDVPYSYLFAIDVASSLSGSSATPPADPASPTRIATTPGQSRVGLFAVGHRATKMPAIPGIRRILAGASEHRPDLDPEIARADIGENIAHRNPDCSEMTAIYWVWKNVSDLDGVGFCHYRRYFDFRASVWQPERETRLRSVRELQQHSSSFVNPALMNKHLTEGTIIVARPTAERMPNAEQYMIAHVAEHYLAMVNYILAHHPDHARQVVSQVSDARFYGNNMFIMPWAAFDGLCRFWFDCLFGIDERLGNLPGGYQRRVLAFLSERIFDVHIRLLRDSGRKVAEYPIFFLEDSAFPDGP